jgi:hypothetical protein
MNNITPEHIDRNLPEFNNMQTVKRRFYAMRNGALAAQMRNAGLNYSINFGLNLPQIKEIAAEQNTTLTSAELLQLACDLWKNNTTRESMLIAPMLYPADLMTEKVALQWMVQAPTTEVADNLCHSLLRKLPFAGTLPARFLNASTATATDSNSTIANTNATTEGSNSATDMQRYTALRLWLNLLILGKADTQAIADAAKTEQQRNCPLTRSLTHRILEEIEFM